MSILSKRILITLAILVIPMVLGLLVTYQVIPIEWVSFMEIQPSFRPMEQPLSIPAQSVPVEGAAYVPGAGSPLNPVAVDAASLSRGELLYSVNCALCHGPKGKGDGTVAEKLVRKPADLTGVNVTGLSDGELFMIITHGVQPGTAKGGMPALSENLSASERWDVVNYVRSLVGK